ncbi:uncharacterized protein BO97DRAFT_412062 [Aspergillus homomorphus CBS 101889]|uniref:Peptidase M12A domain-containing protein n=1 Tax=Aspergillus homomorphus (strain CBS 101889) TaxID=1450537 RepID=A0A395I6F4_ASPHC|nr:hypothetical protein BO97DRAFT_412062 [Aspergillus homomorphus CBS 101889]RAL14758.1 hypothetical protein BO97DRAFT_412062 [Aspergillus homomorphus CBS 101889]
MPLPAHLWQCLMLLLLTLISLSPLVQAWAEFSPWANLNQLWPKGVVSVCYESAATQHKYEPLLRDAMFLWYAAGLPETFKLQSTSPDICAVGIYDTVTVYDTPRLYSTNIGMPPMVPNEGVALVQHKMFLSTPADHPDYVILANIAHEIGHVFGLVHEHQDPALWRDFDGGEWVFKFNCENLEDFDRVTRGMTREQIYGPEGVCVNYRAALNVGFMAADFLPYPLGDVTGPRGKWPSMDQVDWDSIMIYGSTAGAKEGTNVLTKIDGTVFLGNLVPSSGDVAGIMEMYNSAFANDFEPFWNDPRSPHFYLFQQYSSCG